MRKIKEWFGDNVYFIVVSCIVIVLISAAYIYGDLFKSKQEVICENLEIKGHVYPEVVDSKNKIETGWNLHIINMFGDEGSVWKYDEDGVSCRLPSEMCVVNYFYCFRSDMMIPVNYTEYDSWKTEVKNGNI